jgi:hypothetical protein
MELPLVSDLFKLLLEIVAAKKHLTLSYMRTGSVPVVDG